MVFHTGTVLEPALALSPGKAMGASRRRPEVLRGSGPGAAWTAAPRRVRGGELVIRCWDAGGLHSHVELPHAAHLSSFRRANLNRNRFGL